MNDRMDDRMDERTDEEQRRSTEKDPAEWVTGDEPATGAQMSYLQTLSRQAGEDAPENLTKAEASERIDALRGRLGQAGG